MTSCPVPGVRNFFISKVWLPAPQIFFWACRSRKSNFRKNLVIMTSQGGQNDPFGIFFSNFYRKSLPSQPFLLLSQNKQLQQIFREKVCLHALFKRVCTTNTAVIISKTYFCPLKKRLKMTKIVLKIDTFKLKTTLNSPQRCNFSRGFRWYYLV